MNIYIVIFKRVYLMHQKENIMKYFNENLITKFYIILLYLIR